MSYLDPTGPLPLPARWASQLGLLAVLIWLVIRYLFEHRLPPPGPLLPQNFYHHVKYQALTTFKRVSEDWNGRRHSSFPKGVHEDDVVRTGLVRMVALREHRKTTTSVSNRIWQC
jgi:hypothetical protein